MTYMGTERILAAWRVAITYVTISLSCLILCNSAGAVSHNVYLVHPNAISNPGEHTYANEIERLREALTDTLPVHEYVVQASPTVATSTTNNHISHALERIVHTVPESLRITRANRNHSVITLMNLSNDNRSAQQSVDLIVRDRDLYVMGFINGPSTQRTFYRLRTPPGRREPHVPALPSTLGNPSDIRWATHRTTDLDLNYDYPNLEYTAGIGRYSGNLDISLQSLRAAVMTLADYSGSTAERAQKRLAGAILRIIVAYFEGARFRSISQAIEQAGFDNGQEWIVTPREARITNAWRELTEFGSINALNDTNTQTLALRAQGGMYRFSASLNNLQHESWYRTTAVVLATQWYRARHNSCPPAVRRHPRDLSLHTDPCEDPTENNAANNTLIRIGNSYYEKVIGSALHIIN
ncbi:hypothetical protein AY555_10525 (plasmid) [Haematospirillum jordaniae]|uniref:Uncharacterized protein n=2 Tax=Haematospirillum jordaniae TaxID=1549855 RepID=A0A143DHI9_9PROT|nr:hypothetical protein AY555_10525 [Haematospirillum jordaniae]